MSTLEQMEELQNIYSIDNELFSFDFFANIVLYLMNECTPEKNQE